VNLRHVPGFCHRRRPVHESGDPHSVRCVETSPVNVGLQSSHNDSKPTFIRLLRSSSGGDRSS
jgi:hypothetical protein